MYLTAISFNEKIYGIEIKADVLKQQESNKYSYAGHRVREINIYAIKNPEVTPGCSPITSGKISIAQLKKNFK